MKVSDRDSVGGAHDRSLPVNGCDVTPPHTHSGLTAHEEGVETHVVHRQIHPTYNQQTNNTNNII